MCRAKICGEDEISRRGAPPFLELSVSNQHTNEAAPLFASPHLPLREQAPDGQARERKNAAQMCGIRMLIALRGEDEIRTRDTVTSMQV